MDHCHGGPGTHIHCVIDFYVGRTLPGQSNAPFFLDVRPALDSWEAVSMRACMFVNK